MIHLKGEDTQPNAQETLMFEAFRTVTARRPLNKEEEKYLNSARGQQFSIPTDH